MRGSLLLRGGTVVTMDPVRSVHQADVLVRDGRIVAIGAGTPTPAGATSLDCAGMHLVPGFVQGHVHLGQALFRGLAEGLELLPWLRDRILPLEAAHDDDSAYWGALLGGAECLLSGTTTIQDIGLVHGMDSLLRAVADLGIRAIVGKCLMDGGVGVPARLVQTARDALAEARAIHDAWNGAGDGRIRIAICPRFLLSCSNELWEGVVELARELRAPVHTHLLEHPREEEEVRDARGCGQMDVLDQLGVLDTDLRIAHGVGFSGQHRRTLDGRRLGVVHCPTANLKLGAGIADVVFLRSCPELAVGIGCDGAACNDDMDVLEELRLAALLQNHRHGPGTFSSIAALELATIEGARLLGLDHEIGSIEIGKAADIVVLDLRRPATFAASSVSIYDRIVYSASRDAVRRVIVDGIVRVEDGRLLHMDHEALERRPLEAIEALLARAQLSDGHRRTNER